MAKPHLSERSQSCNCNEIIQVWTEIIQQKDNDRIMVMWEEMENIIEAILTEIRTNKSASTITNPRYEINKNQNIQPSGSKKDRSTELHASNIKYSISEDKDQLLTALDMGKLRGPARPVYQNVLNLNETIFSKEDSEEEAYPTIRPLSLTGPANLCQDEKHILECVGASQLQAQNVRFQVD